MSLKYEPEAGLLNGFTPPVPEGTDMARTFSGTLDADRLEPL